ncbi:dihydroxyacetone kinase subunit L [Phytoactinopolyspora alkaliphila]|uniref:Dihydroxyacetone kinase subunit L n=1 Tax=Phytoactinopolyspora alkaliphila TaxID=1783498 RepID=A0A6N9YMS0_9ACTN|nr:dihydroxyacetone kinase subunit DhaL [Phytoactinopolyspora alkaliphila]NED96158.1 dihydroxyacetone kinase subunit L [Phytoactinopolyspora alkaliphila]
MIFDTQRAIAWINRIAELVRADVERLTTLDTAIGDGDHGANLDRGMTAAVDALAEKEPETPGKVLITAGRGLVSKTGGASGPLYGSGFRAAGKAMRDEGDVVALSDALEAMLRAIEELGGAHHEDKTMVDAFAPAVAAFQQAAGATADMHTAAVAAAEAAEAGLAATVPLQARKGRASYLGPRSVGHEDPGAASTVLIFRALADVTAE